MYIANLNLLSEARAYDLCISSARNDVKIRIHLKNELEQEFATLKQQSLDLLTDAQVWYYGTARWEMLERNGKAMAEIQEQWNEHDAKQAEDEKALRSHVGPNANHWENALMENPFI